MNARRKEEIARKLATKVVADCRRNTELVAQLEALKNANYSDADSE